MGGESDQRRPSITLRLLSAKSSAHARRLHDDSIAREMQYVGHDRLDFAGMLGGRGNEEVPVPIELRPSSVRLEIEMLLPAHLDEALQRVCGGACQRRAPVTATLHGICLGVKAAGGNSFRNRENRRQRLVLHLHERGGSAAGGKRSPAIPTAY